MQKLELERNPVNDVPGSVGPVIRVALVLGSAPRNKPVMRACMDWTSKPKVWISVPDPIKPTPLSSPFSGGGVPHASILGLAGFCESLQAMAATSSATAAADARRPKVRTMRLSPREVYADGRGKSRTASDAHAKAASATPAQRRRSVKCGADTPWREIVITQRARGPRAACDARALSRQGADSEPMAKRKNRRDKADRRGGADRRNKQTPVERERRRGSERRTGLERRLELETAGDQIQAAVDLLTYALDQGILIDVDRWLLQTAVARLRLAVEQLGEATDDSS